MPGADNNATQYSNAEGWFYVCTDGTDVGPFESEWAMFKYCEDRDINETADFQNPEIST
jgi:hypothetical protein